MRAYHHREVKIEERDEQNISLIHSEPIQAEVKIQYNPEEYPLITWWPLKANIQQLKKLSVQIPKKPRFFKTMKNILQNLLYQMISLEESQNFKKRFQLLKTSISLIFLILMYVLKFQSQKRSLISVKYQESIIRQLSGETSEQMLYTEKDRFILQESIRFVNCFLFQSPIDALSNFIQIIYSVCQSQIGFEVRQYYKIIQKTICSNQNPKLVYLKIINKSLSRLQGYSDESQQNNEEEDEEDIQPQLPSKQKEKRGAIVFDSQQQSKQINTIKKLKPKSIQGDFFLIYKAQDLTRKASYPIDQSFELKSNYKQLLPKE